MIRIDHFSADWESRLREHRSLLHALRARFCLTWIDSSLNNASHDNREGTRTNFLLTMQRRAFQIERSA